ncbi:terpenoid synthase [Panus rudis PR-1116 ss-1]|nr:terpenoid synthase [Panus rudis PR-1116 ss-1]
MQTPTTFKLPDLLALCPMKGRTNPNYALASAASSKWVLSFGVFKDNKANFFQQGGSELLCSHAYPYADYEELRTCCDLVNLLFTVDEISDEQDGAGAYKTGRVFYKALSDPDFDDGSTLCTMTKQFRQRLFPRMGPATYRRFLQHCKDYVDGFTKEAELREHNVVLDSASYEALRRENSAVRFCFGLFGYVLGLDLPDYIFNDPVMMSMHLAAVDTVCWSNDLYSYNMEQAMGHTGNNILTVLMKEKGLDLQGAADYVGEYFKVLIDRFLDGKAKLPSWGPEMDATVSQYIMAMESWIIGNLEWSFATQRYFGTQRQAIRETLTVELYPKKA